MREGRLADLSVSGARVKADFEARVFSRVQIAIDLPLWPKHQSPVVEACVTRSACSTADTALEARLIERGRADYHKDFTREAVTRRMIALYTEIIAERMRPGAAATGERA